jgi:hypothetical protein
MHVSFSATSLIHICVASLFLCVCLQSGFKAASLPEGYQSAATQFERPHAHGVQFHAPPLPGDVVGQPYQHMAADLQVSMDVWVLHPSGWDCQPCVWPCVWHMLLHLLSMHLCHVCDLYP